MIVVIIVWRQGDAVNQHTSSAVNILMSPMEFQTAGSVGSLPNSVSARISGW